MNSKLLYWFFFGIGSGDGTPGGSASAFLLEDGLSGILLEDGISFLLLE